MGRGGRRKRKQRADEDSNEPRHAIGRAHAAFLGAAVGAGGGVVLAIEWLEDFELVLPLAGGGAVVAGVLAAVVGDKVWETIVDWL